MHASICPEGSLVYIKNVPVEHSLFRAENVFSMKLSFNILPYGELRIYLIE
jgi:hypothetical protein